MDEASGTELYRRWREGNLDAGNEIAARYCEPILAFFNSKVPEAAEDLMQKTFLTCQTSNVEADAVRSLRGLLFGIARNLLLQHLEGRGRLKGEVPVSHLSLAELRTTPTQRIAREQQQARVFAALEQLSLDEQIGLELYYWHRMSVREIASVLELTEGGVRAKLHRARQRFKKALARVEAAADHSS